MERIKIGLVGTSQLSFPGDKEGAFRRGAEGMGRLAETLGFELTVYPETVITREDAQRAVAAMNRSFCFCVQQTDLRHFFRCFSIEGAGNGFFQKVWAGDIRCFQMITFIFQDPKLEIK